MAAITPTNGGVVTVSEATTALHGRGSSGTTVSAFQMDLLLTIPTVAGPTCGLDIKRRLEEEYDTVHHAMLYTNLDTLVDHGLVEKGTIDRRTNSYELTAAGWDVLERRRAQFDRVLEDTASVDPDVGWVDEEAETDGSDDEGSGSDDGESDDTETETEPTVGDLDAATKAEIAELLPDEATHEDVAEVVADVRYVHEVADAFELSEGTARAMLHRLDLYSEVYEGRDRTGGSR